MTELGTKNLLELSNLLFLDPWPFATNGPNLFPSYLAANSNKTLSKQFHPAYYVHKL